MTSSTDTLSFEDALRELVSIVEKLEAGQLPLNENITLYERGQKLTTHCNQLLDNAEVQVRTITDNDSTDITNDTDLKLF